MGYSTSILIYIFGLIKVCGSQEAYIRGNIVMVFCMYRLCCRGYYNSTMDIHTPVIAFRLSIATTTIPGVVENGRGRERGCRATA